MSQVFTSGGQSIGASASALVLSMNIQDWLALGLTGLISLQSKRLSWVFSNTTVQKHQFFGDQHSLIFMGKIIFSLKHFYCCTIFSCIYVVEEIMISKCFFLTCMWHISEFLANWRSDFSITFEFPYFISVCKWKRGFLTKHSWKQHVLLFV